ncbi:MAG: uridine diphosphate-N-acetylglucosamine-binding protein YvcK [Eubacteriales bacterium]
MKDNINIVAIGGGTGLSTMLRGLKKYSNDLTAIVTMSDNGGSSGVLRQEMKMLPPGDIRNCIVALANTEPIMEKVFQYRFKEGSLRGQNFGNIFLAAMNDIFGSFELAVEKTSKVLAVTGKVLPVTLEDIQLCAELESGQIIKGETQIVSSNIISDGKIKRVYLQPSIVKPYDKVVKAIKDADIIILGPGSLYTSIIPNLMVDGIAKELEKSNAKVVYIANLMTQPGETDGFTLSKHIDAIEEHCDSKIIDVVIVNNEEIPENVLKLYDEDGAKPIFNDYEKYINKKIVKAPLVTIKEKELYIRHDENKLAQAIIELV